MFRIGLSNIFLVISCLVTFGQSTNSTPMQAPAVVTKVFVKLVVTGETMEADMVRSYLSRQLRSLGDIRLVDENEDVVINCLVMQSRNKAGNITGSVESYAITSQITSKIIAFNLPKLPDSDAKTQIQQCISNDGVLMDHFVAMSSDSELQESVNADLAKIDGADLELVRKSYGIGQR